VTHLLAFAAGEGLNREALMEGAGLREGDLTDPDFPVPFSTLIALWQLIAKAKGASDPGFGVRWGASFRVRDFGLLGYAMHYSSTLAAALRRLVRYGRILTDAVAFELEEADPRHRVAVAVAHPALGAGLPFAVDSRLAALVGACRAITGVEGMPSEVTFTYPQPRITTEHRNFFRCTLRFGEALSKVVFLERDLRLPALRGDETLAGYLSDYAEHVLRTLVTGTSTRERVRSAIWAVLSEGRPTLEGIASALQMPSRTLQRRLAEEGSSLQAEAEHIRKAMAMAALRDRAIPIEEVAFILGYTEPSTFYRSFKRWTGKTPHQYRTAAA
jgi:AraC-like DNA-binding protein